MKKIHIKERDNDLLSEGLIITAIDDDGNEETVDVLKETFSTDLSDYYEAKVKFVEQSWPWDIYIEDIELGYVYPTPFSEAVVYMDNNSLVVEDKGEFPLDYMTETKVSIDTTNHNLLQIIIGYEDYFYRGFEVIFRKKDATPSETEEKTILNAYKVLYQEVKWLKSLSWDSKEIINRYKRDGYLKFEFSDFEIKVEMDDIPSFYFEIDFRYLKRSEYDVLEIRINDHMRFHVCCNTVFTINDIVKFTIEKKN